MKKRMILAVALAMGLATAWGQAAPHVAIGDILCSDNSTVRREDWPAEGKTAIGVVFYVEQRDGAWHGWAVGLKEQQKTRWADANHDQQIYGQGFTATSSITAAVTDTCGFQNTHRIFDNAEITSAYYPALYYVQQQESRWYLPAMGQLHYLFGYLSEVNATFATLNAAQANTATAITSGSDFSNKTWSYFSSTESTTTYYVWLLNHNGGPTTDLKPNLKRVRAVTSF